MVSVGISASLPVLAAVPFKRASFAFPQTVARDEYLLMDPPPDFLDLFYGSFLLFFRPGGPKLVEFWGFGLDQTVKFEQNLTALETVGFYCDLVKGQLKVFVGLVVRIGPAG